MLALTFEALAERSLTECQALHLKWSEVNWSQEASDVEGGGEHGPRRQFDYYGFILVISIWEARF